AAAPPEQHPYAYLVLAGEAAEKQGWPLAEMLRDALPALRLVVHCGGGALKNQLKRADKSGARYALILGDEEVRQAGISVKDLRTEQAAQILMPQHALADFLAKQV
ncbi:MAG: His/Gly/Thr/Pro-type tRNA ligase C-terminal domain-containing protein, partial [Gammaproteobacteria bacterium]|nr:His/Gly/Thr/Pro-type tRNA ligase C-terminal domain-containing protein [Gammaproteobacteria bacterium]